jgi:hypothetical protein
MRKPVLIEESFEEASRQLIELLRKQRMPDQLVWVFREDVTGFRRGFFTHPSPPKLNRDLSHRLFDFGVKQARGIRLTVLGFAGDLAYSYVDVPADDVGAGQGMICGLHLAVALESHETGRGKAVTRVRFALFFWLVQLWCRFRGEPFFIKKIPLRQSWL